MKRDVENAFIKVTSFKTLRNLNKNIEIADKRRKIRKFWLYNELLDTIYNHGYVDPQ